jgi:AraC-like DNA-binding protein
MQVEILDLFKDTMEAFGAQVLYLKPPYEEAKKIDLGIGVKLYGNFDYQIIMEEVVKSCAPDTIYVVRNMYFMHHFYFAFPESLREEYGYTHCVIGPMLAYQPTDEEILNLMQEKGIDLEKERDLHVFYSQMPLMPSQEKWNSLLIQFCRRIFKKEPTLIQSETAMDSIFSLHYNSFTVCPDPDFSTETIERRYESENKFLESVRKGDYAEATLRFNEFMKFRIQPRHGDSVRDMKNLMFVQNTLLRKTVEQASVHPLYIDELSRKMAVEIERMNTVSQLLSIRGEMIRKYCLLVENYSRRGYSQLVHNCLDYVDFHYMEPISLKSLADQFYVSNTHLSTLFKKEVNMNLKEYIQEVRLRHARLMLNTTRLPIQEIASNCGFFDVNYFTRVFRKVHGISPRAYRNKMYNIQED